MKRVLLDQGFAPSAARILRNDGWDALHVSKVDMAQADDASILEFARREQRTCFTLDHDFHTHLALTHSGWPSVVFVRLEGLSSSGQVELIRKILQSCEEALVQGAAVTVTASSVRIRYLPLRPRSERDQDTETDSLQ